MSASSSSSATPELPIWQSRWWMVVVLPLWVLVGFGLAQVLFFAALFVLRHLGVAFAASNPSVVNAVAAASVYVLTLAIVVGVPWWAKKQQVSGKELGLTRLPSWMDMGLAPAGFIIYLLVSVVLAFIAGLVAPNLDMNQVQETGFSDLSFQYEYLLAFATLVVLAPIAEEVLFRGYLYGKLRKLLPVWATILIVSGLFALVHGQWNVAIDVFALSIVLCGLREVTGSIWAGILLHMLKNGIAFYFLFINTTFLQ